MRTSELNVITMAEAVIEVQNLFSDKLSAVPKGTQLNDELKGYVGLHHANNQKLVIENQFATLKQGKRDLVETGAEELINQILLFANMENRPEIKVKVDLNYADLHSVSGDKLIDTCNGLYTLGADLDANLTEYRGTGITPSGLKQRIDEYAALLAAPRMDIAARSAINAAMEANVATIRSFLNEKMDVAMNIVKNSEPEYYDAYTSARVIVDRHGKRNAKKPADETTGMISGTITEVETGTPLADVIVQLEGVEEATTTDETGDFSFDEVVPGVFTITCIKETYKNLELTGIEVKAGEETEVEGAMEKE
jgi:hypothetical protein